MKDRHISRPWETLSFCCSPSWSSLNTNRSSILCVFHLPQTFNPSTSIVLWPFCWFWSAVVISLSPSLSMRCRSSALSKRSVHFSGPFPWYRILPWSILRPSYVLRQSYELIEQSGAPFLASVLCAAHFHPGIQMTWFSHSAIHNLLSCEPPNLGLIVITYSTIPPSQYHCLRPLKLPIISKT